jgi:hypothetical protein
MISNDLNENVVMLKPWREYSVVSHGPGLRIRENQLAEGKGSNRKRSQPGFKC